VFVPDERLDDIAGILKPDKVTYAEITFLDTHGLDLVHSREADGLVIVLGVFSEAPPKKDAEEILTNMALSDLEIIERRLPRMKKEIESGKKFQETAEYNLLLKCETQLGKNRPLRELHFAKEEERLLGGYQFLTMKNALFAANIAEGQIGGGLAADIADFARNENIEVIELCAKTEEEILELAEAERLEFLKGLGIDALSEDKIIKAAFRTMNLISFFTVKGAETRAWPVRKGTRALDAAGKVHTDIQRGFIKAEVINYGDFCECGDFNEARKRGLLKLEGRDYVVQDGDIINFKFNV
jgi:ribosome-binding ATPase YchF (GTP1/OBG family)